MRLKLLPTVLIAAAMIATPVMARQSGVASRHLARDAYATTTPASPYPASPYNDGPGCVRAPNVGAYASDPYVVPPCEPMTGY
jgi:hypothetical protein